MGNSIKYTTGTESNSLVKGNFRIGTGDVGKGPSSSTGFYKATTPPSGGYRIYINNESVSGGIAYHTASNDSELISFTNQIAGESYTAVSQCFNYYTSQNDKVCVNNQFGDIPTDSLTTHYDLSQVTCYPFDFTVNENITSQIRDLTSVDGKKANLYNRPVYTANNGGGIVLDGTNNFIRLDTSPVTVSPLGMTYFMWVSNITLQGTRDFFINFDATVGTTALRYSSSSFGAGGQPTMEFFAPNSGFHPFQGMNGYLLPNVNYPLFLCITFINRGEGNYGCSLVMNDGNSGLVMGNIPIAPFSTNPIFGTHDLGGSALAGDVLNGTVNMFSAYSKSFFPVSIFTPNLEIIPEEIQQYYDATKGRFGL